MKIDEQGGSGVIIFEDVKPQAGLYSFFLFAQQIKVFEFQIKHVIYS